MAGARTPRCQPRCSSPRSPAIALLQAGVVDDVGVLLVVEHVAMVLGMLGAMLLPPTEHTHRHAEAHLELQVAAVTRPAQLKRGSLATRLVQLAS